MTNLLLYQRIAQQLADDIRRVSTSLVSVCPPCAR